MPAAFKRATQYRIMIKFESTHADSAVMTLYALQDKKGHKSYPTEVHLEDVLGQWIDLNLQLDNTSTQNSVSLSIDGETLLSDIPFWNEDCGNLHIKFGAYRPGNLAGNVKSVVDFDSINVN